MHVYIYGYVHFYRDISLTYVYMPVYIYIYVCICLYPLRLGGPLQRSRFGPVFTSGGVCRIGPGLASLARAPERAQKHSDRYSIV